MAKGIVGKKYDANALRITNSNPRFKQELKNIAKSLGMTYGQFCRRELLKIAASYPESARNYSDDVD